MNLDKIWDEIYQCRHVSTTRQNLKWSSQSHWLMAESCELMSERAPL